MFSRATDNDVRRREAEAITASPHPTVLLALPDEVILAISPAAADLFHQEGQDLVGRRLIDFTEGLTDPGLQLLSAGRLMGFEAVQQLRSHTGDAAWQVWVRALDDPPHRLAVAVFGAQVSAVTAPAAEVSTLGELTGSIDAQLIMRRLVDRSSTFLGYDQTELLGRSLLSLIDVTDVGTLLAAMAQALTPGMGGTVRLRCRTAAGEVTPMLLLLQPLLPRPSCAFTLVPDPPGSVPDMIVRLTVGREQLAAAYHDADHANSRLQGLTERELLIVTLLLSGDRVPAIARSLYVSQSTVRNHLSSIFRKAGVGSQQELIDVVRKPDGVLPT